MFVRLWTVRHTCFSPDLNLISENLIAALDTSAFVIGYTCHLLVRAGQRLELAVTLETSRTTLYALTISRTVALSDSFMIWTILCKVYERKRDKRWETVPWLGECRTGRDFSV